MKRNGRMETFYLVKWEGYPREEDQTWEPLSHLESVKQLVHKFEKERKSNRRKEADGDKKYDTSSFRAT